MGIVLVGDSWWQAACEALGEPYEVIPAAKSGSEGLYDRDLASRRASGAILLEKIKDADPELILDNGSVSLGFVDDPGNAEAVKLLHEVVGVPYASHWVDPMVTVFQSVAWDVVWQCLQSESWHKFAFDEPQTYELNQMGVPNAHYVPMAALNLEYNTQPLNEKQTTSLISFVGSQNTNVFAQNSQLTGDQLLPSALAQSVRCDMPDVSYYDVYFGLYGLDEPISESDSFEQKTEKAIAYYNKKLIYSAIRCMHQRDRFVLFLKKRLGNTFQLIGQRWDIAYGLECQAQFPTTESYLEHFRNCAINLNFANGNTDSGLNMRHFEITAAGGFMLCYHQPEIDDFFEVGKECDTFRNEHELLEKIQFYLEHPEIRTKIAYAGQQRTLGEHLYSHRLNKILNIVRKESSQKRSMKAEPRQQPAGV